MTSSTFVSAHYYVDGMPHAAACTDVREACAFLRQAYDDPGLGAVALEIRIAAGIDELSWKSAFNRIFEDRHYGVTRISWPVDRDALPKCVIAGYRSGGRTNVRSFTTVAEALEFFPKSGGQQQRVEVAKLRIHLTASDALVIVLAHTRFPKAWDLALDIVLRGGITAGLEDAVLCDSGKAGVHSQPGNFVDPQTMIAAA